MKKMIEVYFRSMCVSFLNLALTCLQGCKVYMFVNYMYQKMPSCDSSLIKTLVNFVTVKYNPSLISCNKVVSEVGLVCYNGPPLPDDIEFHLIDSALVLPYL